MEGERLLASGRETCATSQTLWVRLCTTWTMGKRSICAWRWEEFTRWSRSGASDKEVLGGGLPRAPMSGFVKSLAMYGESRFHTSG